MTSLRRRPNLDGFSSEETLRRFADQFDPFQDGRVLPRKESQRGFWAQEALGPEAARVSEEARPVRPMQPGDPDRFKCLLIGEGTLPILCGEILRNHGHEVCGVISSDALVVKWAEQARVPHWRDMLDVASPLVRQPFDYLFSISNPRILRQEILDLPRKGAINYHDALLPRYAGRHATSWALVNQERYHGITWHLMDSRVDTGDLLLQRRVDIASGETAFTLNVKCYEAAVASFQQLVNSLSSGHESTQKQNPGERTFHSRCKKPVPGCVVSWHRGADEIDSLLRALDFGPYPNDLGSPKFMINGEVFILPSIEILNSFPDVLPGTITRIEPEDLRVATATHEVALHGLRTIEGQPIPMVDFVARYQLHEGDRLDEVDPQLSRRLAAMDASLCQHEAFWVQRLAASEPFVFPGETPVLQPVGSLQSAEKPMTIPAEVWQMAFDCTGAEFLLAAYAIYLARSGGIPKIGFSDVELKRKVAGLEGFFSSQVPLCLDLNPAHTFAEVREIVRAEVALVRRRLTYARDVVNRYPVLSSRSPLENGCAWPVSVDWVERWDDGVTPTGAEVGFVVAEGQEEYRWVYHPERFGGPEIARRSSQFHTLLDGILAAGPEARIWELPLLDKAEREQILVGCNDTAREYPAGTLHGLFEAQAVLNPEAVAVIFEGESLTYGELNRRANQMAHRLRDLGVAADVPIGICAERSMEVIIALLATLKAGGAYLPLDPSHPRERLNFILQEARPPVVLVQDNLVAVLPAHHGRLVLLEEDFEAEAETNLAVGVQPENLAYVLYTSGSTGQPKGVMITHQAVCNRMHWAQAVVPLSPRDCMMLKAPLTFDVSVSEVFWPLTAGARLVIAQPGRQGDGRYLIDTIRQYGVTTTEFVPAMLALLLEDDDFLRCDSLRQVISGAEALPADLMRRFHAGLLQAELYNSYGPTETTIDATFWKCERGSSDPVVPIGLPHANTQAYILDPCLQPVPPGVAGELHIGGVQLARGYLNRAELTAERFIPNPFGQGKLYKTGDRCRYRPDGVLEFLGRLDHQIKLRGFRIELGEIEAVLRRHPGVRECVVLTREDGARSAKRLVAYVAANAAAPTPPDLRAFLASQLPDYMVPAAFVFLDRLPMSPNGKLDRRALPEPEQHASTAFVAPRTPVERKVAEIWQDVLGVARVGREDNFFERGGNSLLALRLVNRLSDWTAERVTLALVFQVPTLARFAAVLEQEYDGGERAVAACRGIPRLPRPIEPNQEAVFRASFAQRQLWLVDQLTPGTATYNILRAFRVTGNLDVRALERSLGELVRRHEILRTTFRAGAQGDPLQVIAPSLELALPVVDLRGLPSDERARQLTERTEAEAAAPFDLGQGPLLRTALLRTEECEHVLVLSFHHIVFDAWSQQVLMRELLAAYKAFVAGREPDFPELPIQYADYAQWQRELLNDQPRKEQLGFWRDRLADLPVLQLPTDRPRLGPAAVGANEPVAVLPSVAHALRELGRAEGASLFATVLAAFKVLLARYSGQDDLVVGSPIANRDCAEAEALMGYFLNPLVLRTKLDGNPTFRDALRRVRDGALAAFAHRDLPFDSLVEALAPQRDAGVNPLFQAAFVLVEKQAVTYLAPGVRFDVMEVEDRTAKFDLLLSLTDESEGLRGNFNYNVALFEPATIRRMARHFGNLLQGVAANPEARLSALPLLEEAEREQVIVAWNRTEALFPANASISEVFEGQAAQRPDALALEHGTTRWTYRELNARANQLAYALRHAGVSRETLVGLCLERSVQLVLAMLAVLKAGGAYVPIDPAYPAARRALMLEGVPMVITPRALAREFAGYAGHLLHMEEAQTVSTGTDNLPRLADGGSLAYVIYTSGSTGPSKGVAIPHRAVNRLVLNTNYIALDGSAVVAQTSNCCFDAATFEVWGALLNGARLVVIDQAVILSPTALAEELHLRGITTLWLTTPLFNLMAQHAPGAFGGLRHVLFGGEAADPRSVAAVLQHGAPRHLINGYGPTETTTFAACHEVHAVPEGARTIPIGKPIANTTLYLLDAWRNPVPIGVAGEIHVGGPGLARGYVDAPELTAQRFVPNPFSSQPGARLYRTGDLGRWLADGTVECLGRLDQQVKIRGFRIEPGEVEAALKHHPGVRDAAVVVRGQAGDQKRLVAYVVGEPLSLRESALRDYLKATLPDYLVPSALVVLDQLPLTPNGKLDRRALPDPAVILTEKALVPPRDALETQLVAIWEKVLEHAPVGVTDDFFELGGNSLRAVRVFVEIKEAFRKQLPLATLVRAPTIEALAQALRSGTCSKDWSPLVPIQLRGNQPPFFGIHGVHGNILFYRPLAQLLGDNQPFYGIQSQGLDGTPITRTSVEAMADYYLEEIRNVQPHGPYLLGGYSLGGSIAYEMARGLRLAGEDVPLLVLIDAGNPARPARLVSYGARLRKALRDPASLFTADRFARILAGRIRGKAGDCFLQWNDLYQTAKARRRKARHRDVSEEVDFHVVMVHTRALLAYRPLPSDGKIILFKTLTPEPGYESDFYLGWDLLAEGGLEVHEFPGAHLELFSDENLPALAEVLRGCIRSALGIVEQSSARGPEPRL